MCWEAESGKKLETRLAEVGTAHACRAAEAVQGAQRLEQATFQGRGGKPPCATRPPRALRFSNFFPPF